MRSVTGWWEPARGRAPAQWAGGETASADELRLVSPWKELIWVQADVRY